MVDANVVFDMRIGTSINVVVAVVLEEKEEKEEDDECIIMCMTGGPYGGRSHRCGPNPFNAPVDPGANV